VQLKIDVPRRDHQSTNDLRKDDTSPSLYSLIQPAFEHDTSSLQPIPVSKLHRVRENLHLLPGSTKIVEFEHFIALADLPAQTVGQLHITVFRKMLLIDTARFNRIKFIIIDLGPSSGVLNRVFVMTADYLLLAAFADRMSLCSTDGLLRSVFPRWIEWFQQAKTLEDRRLETHPKWQEQHFKIACCSSPGYCRSS